VKSLAGMSNNAFTHEYKPFSNTCPSRARDGDDASAGGRNDACDTDRGSSRIQGTADGETRAHIQGRRSRVEEVEVDRNQGKELQTENLSQLLAVPTKQSEPAETAPQ